MRFKPDRYFKPFEPGKDLQEVEKILRKIETKKVGLYVHIPFCKIICPFCPYNKVLHDPDLERTYENALLEELNFYLSMMDGEFDSLYFGGGTPTLMLKTLGKISDKVRVRNERAVEYLPNSSPEEEFSMLRDMGISYISIGIQSMNEEVLRYLKRPNSVDDNVKTLKSIKKFFDFVDADLIFDSVKFDENVVVEDAKKLFEFGVDQISIYPLMRFGYTPFGKGKHDRKKEHLILKKVEEIGCKYGYRRTSVWTFGRMEEKRYTSITREFYVGIGAGSATYLKDAFYVNHFSPANYSRAVEENSIPIAIWRKLGRFDSMLFYSFWRFYTGELDFNLLWRYFGFSTIPMKLFSLLLFLFRCARFDDGKCILTSKGFNLFHDIEEFVTYRYIEPLWEYMRKTS